MAAESVDVQKDFNSIPIVGIVPEQGTSAPATTVEGRLLTRTDLHTLMVVLNGIAKTLVTTDGSLPPNGSAGGDLSGSYPNPDIGNNKVTLAKLALALIESGVSSGTAATTDPALRKLGTGANDAMAGNRALDTITAPAGDVSMNSHKLTNLLDGTNPQDAVTFAQLSGAIQGIDSKQEVLTSVIVAPGTWNAGSGTWTGVGSTIDGSAMGAGNRVLVAIPSPGANRDGNGIFTWSSAASGTLTRATDADTSAEYVGAFVFVIGGTRSNTGWLTSWGPGDTLNTTAMNWSQFSSAGSYTGGAGLTLSGLDFSVNVDGSSIEINADTLRVKALGIVNAMIAAGTIDLTTKVTGVLPAANGGRSTPVASPALTAGTWTDVVHNLGVKAGRVYVKVASTGEKTEVGIRDKSGSETTTIQIKVDIPAGRAANYYDVYCGI